MEASRFDGRLARASRQTTRRGALSTLLGCGLLLSESVAIDATKQAKRRKHRKRWKQARSPFLMPISVQVHNPGPNSVTLQHGYFRESFAYCYCTPINRVPIPPGASLTFHSPSKPNQHL